MKKHITKTLIIAAAVITGALFCAGCASTIEGAKRQMYRTVKGSSQQCPYCSSRISKRAVVCPNCKRDLPVY